MRRRRFLALCGSLAVGAGCTEFDREASPDDTVTPVPSPGTDPEDGSDGADTVEVRSAAVQPAYVGPNSPDSIGAFDDAGQYLLVSVTSEGPAPDRGEFALRFDGSDHSPIETYQGLYREDEWGLRYRDGSGPLVFALSETGDAADARITWPGGEWTPPAAVRERLAAPLPSFEVALDGRTVVREGDDPTVTVRVTNADDRAGRYALALNRTGPRVAYAPVARIAGDLGPGETATHEFDAPSPYVADPPREMIYRLDAPGDAADATLTIRPATAATPEDPVTEATPTGTRTATDG